MSGQLYIVATPIGNLNDITLRAIDVLKSVDFIAAEDTRHTRQLCNHFEIEKQIIPHHDHSTTESSSHLIDRIAAGENCALVSDAGTPLISDPGYELVNLAVAAGVDVVPVVGACAAIGALSVSGLPSDRFSFEGFLPSKTQSRKNVLAELGHDTRTLIFYEAPHRILATLNDMVEVYGAQRSAAIARELTKKFETITRGTLEDLAQFVAADSNQQRGEIVLMVEGASSEGELDAKVKKAYQIVAAELPPKKASKMVGEMFGVKAKEIYQWALTQKSL